MRGFKDVSAEKWALWVSVAALCVSVVTCLLVLLFMITRGQKDAEAIGYLAGQVNSLNKEMAQITADSREREEKLREQIQMQQAIAISLRADMVRAGVEITPIKPVGGK